MQQQIGSATSSSVDLKASTSWCGMVANEAHRVGQDDLGIAGERHMAHGGIKGREQLVGDVYPGSGQAIEERGLAGIV